MGTSYYSMKMVKSKKLGINEYYSDLQNAHTLKGIFDEKPSNKCRICFQDGTLPICDAEITSNIAEILKIFTNTDYKENSQSKHLCIICYKFVRNALIFRKMARQADEILKRQLREDSNQFAEDNRRIV